MITVKGYEKRMTDHARMHRLVAYMVYCANTKNPKSIEVFMRLPGDFEEDMGEELTDMQAQMLILERLKKLNGQTQAQA